MDGASVLLVTVPAGLLLAGFALQRGSTDFWRLRTELFSWLVVSAGLSFLLRSIDSGLVDVIAIGGQAAVAFVSVGAFRRHR